MRKTIYKSRAIMITVLVAALVVILTVWPLRLWRRMIVIEPDGKPLVKSESVNDERSAGQTFVARYDRLDSIDIFMSSLEGGRYLSFSIRGEDGVILCERYVDMGEAEIPGYVRVPLGIGLTVNANYRFTIRGRFASFRIANEPAGSSPQLAPGFLYYNDDVIMGQQMRMRLCYDQPVGKGTSLLYMGIAAAAAALIICAVRMYYRRHPARDRLMLAGHAMRPVLYAVSLLFYGALFIMAVPMKLFHDAPLETGFMGTGIILACALTLYAAYRATGDEEPRTHMPLYDRIIVVPAALVIAFCCEYMNGVTDAMHAASEKKILFFLAVTLIAAFLVPGQKKRIHPGRYGIFTFFVFAVMVVFRNTRMWVIVLAVFFTLLYLCIARGFGTKRWLAIARSAILLHFFLSVGYCLLFRMYQAFNFARYPMIFHTVTVTAEYLSMVCAVTAAGLFVRIADRPPKDGVRKRLKGAWREILLFGLSASYALFTISRVAALAVFSMLALLTVIVVAGVWRGETKDRIVRTGDHLTACVLALVMAFVLCFPAAFTMQRVIPALVRHHHVLRGIEEEWTLKPLLGKADYDSPYHMAFNRFAALFSVRFFGGSEGIYNRPYDKYNYAPDGAPLYGKNGVPIEYEDDTETQETQPPESEAQPEQTSGSEAQGEQTPASGSEAEQATAEAEQAGEHLEEISNGRFEIFRAYLKNTGLRGHPGVGLVTETETYIHAHNTYLQAMYDFGIPAGLLFSAWIGVTILFGIYRYLCGPKDLRPYALNVTALTTAFAAASVAEWTFFLYNPVTVMLFLMTGPLLFNGEEHEAG